MKLSKKYRKHGLHVYCHKHNKVETKAPCSFEKYHVFQSRIWSGKPWNKFKIKNWTGVKEEKEAFELHNKYKEDLIAHDFYFETPKPRRKPFPTLFKDCFNMWLDFLNDVDLPSDEKKNLGTHYVEARARHGKRFLEAVGNKNIYGIDSYDRAKFADKIPGGNRNYNDHTGTMRWFFSWLIEYGYDLENPFANVKQKRVKKKIVVLSNEDLRALFRSISYDNGFKLVGGKRQNYYRDWVSHAFKLSLLTGCRVGEVAHMKLKDVLFSEKVIHIIKRKESKGDDIYDRSAPLTVDLLELIAEIGHREPEDYLIFPDSKSRERVRLLSSLAFTHFWETTKIDKPATFHSLRKTYLTRMEMIQTGVTKFLDVHSTERTTLNHYIGKEEAIRHLSEKRLFDLRSL